MRKIKRALRKKAAAGILIGLTGLLFGPHAAFAGETINYTGTETLQTINGHANSLGPSDLTNVSGNTITIAYSSGTTPTYVFGAYSANADVSNNSIILSSGSVSNFVYGGYSNSGSVTGNIATVSSGTVIDVCGGYSNSGSATGNIATVSGGTVSGTVYGGYSDSGNATNNTVAVSGGTVSSSVFGGYSNSGNVTDNTVTISGSSIISNSVFGGSTFYGNATGNTVTISGGNVDSIVYGGVSDSGNAIGNTVTISGNYTTITRDVYGGFIVDSTGSAGNANGNTIIISGGTISGTIFGGHSTSGNANGNTVIISGGAVGNVYGGSSNSGNATDNTITISGTPSIIGSLYGGFTLVSSSGDVWTGNTLNVKSSGMSAAGVANFQYYNFYLPSTIASGDTMLTVTNAATISNSTIGIYLSTGTTLKAGDTVTLLSGSLTATGINSTARSYLGIATVYDFSLSTGASSTNLIATVSGVSQNSQVKALSEGQVSGAAFLNQGADMLSGQGLQTARSAAAGATGQISSFAALGGGSLRYETGSHVDVNGISFVAGAAKEKPIGQDKLTNGLFLEHGWGSYSTYNSFSNATSVKGSGDTQYFGAGWLGRRQKNSGQYVEGSIRAGQVSNKFNSSDIGTAGTTSSYDVSSPYYGLHIGIGKETDIGKNKKRDVYAKALWTHQNGSSATVQGDSFQFNAVDSLRGQAGVKWLYKTNESTTLRTGLAYQHEFDGNAGATVNGSAVESPSMKGGTGIMEIGLTKENKSGKGPKLDIGLQGFCGKTRGIAGTVQAAWKF